MLSNISSLTGYSIMRQHTSGSGSEQTTTATLLRTGDPCVRELEPTCPCADCYVSRLFTSEADLGFRPLVNIRFYYEQGEIRIRRSLSRIPIAPVAPTQGFALPTCIARGIQ